MSSICQQVLPANAVGLTRQLQVLADVDKVKDVAWLDEAPGSDLMEEATKQRLIVQAQIKNVYDKQRAPSLSAGKKEHCKAWAGMAWRLVP